MSGGSYNYLFCADFPDIVNKISDLENMRDRLSELGFKDLARETNAILEDSREMQRKMEERLSKIQNVWRSVEYYDSADSGLDNVNEEVIKYRGSAKRLTNRQRWALNYMERYKDEYVSPKQIGDDYSREALNSEKGNSSIGAVILKSLESIDRVERNDKGWYKLKKEDA